MLRVYSVKPSSGGFGLFERSTDCVTFEGFDRVEDYVGHVREVNPDATPVTEGDDEYPAVEDAHGRIYRQEGGTVIGWRDDEGNVSLELVVEGD